MQKIIPGIAIPGFEKRPLLFLDPGLRRDDGAKKPPGSPLIVFHTN